MKTEQVTEIESPTTPLEKIDRSLSEVFGTPPMEITEIVDDKGVIPTPNTDENDKVQVDHNFARGNIYNLLQQGNDALGYAVELAKQTDSPRGFEVVATMMKNLADMNMQLMDLHEKKSKIVKPEKEKQEPSKTVNNTVVFTGTTAEINQLLNNMKKEQ